MDKKRTMLFNKAMNLDKQGSAPQSRLPTFSSENMNIGSGPSLETQASLQNSEVMILPKPTKRTQCRWDDDMVKNLVDLMLFVITTYGKRSDNGNKKEVYQYVATEMNKKGYNVNKDNVANKLKQLKEYNAAVETKEKSGFTFDPVQKVIRADRLVWADWVKQKPEAKNLRTKWLQYYDEYAIIFGNDYATGSEQFVANDSHSESNFGESEFDVENASIDVDDVEVNHVPPQTSMGTSQKTSEESSKGGPQKLETNLKKRKRSRLANDDPSLQVFQKMVDVSTILAESLARPSMKNLNEALKSIPNLEKKHVWKAYNMLGKDRQLAEMFFGCDIEDRREWVLEIIGEENE